MLQTKNLTKIYKANGIEVKALDDVTLSFGDSGMCFILGKSGSGKSTLLNVCGGLDAPDSGEIIIKNRSSKDFSQKDFDSYRNTYVGFIFQEYNVLNEFTVEDNVMLALELQGKPRDKATANKLLEMVDLKGLNNRKPNTLSGGQKQRVAIARALVKNPEIIMADEPTGALDSTTGKQVFETLKKLSRDKLVVVISHDREFAERYGDRIIELKDGKVISDVTRQAGTDKFVETVSQVNSNTLLIRSGSKLTDEDIEKIRNVVENSKTDVLITSDEEGVDEYKNIKGMTDDSGRFVDTVQPQQRQYTDEESKFIRSSLPLRHAMRVGVSGIKLKPIRFAFTLLLSIISFVMFGMLSCLMFYNSAVVTANSLYEYGFDYVKLEKNYIRISEYLSEYGYSKNEQNEFTTMSDEDIALCKNKFGENILLVSTISPAEISNLEIKKPLVYSNSINTWLDSSSNLQYIYGSAPEGNNQVAISEYLYDAIMSGVLYDNLNNAISVNSYSDIVLKVENNYHLPDDSEELQPLTLTVSGVFKCDQIYKKLADDKSLESNFLDNTTHSFLGSVAVDMSSFDYFTSVFGTNNGSSIRNNASGAIVTFNDFDIELEINDQADRFALENTYNLEGEKTEVADKTLVLPVYQYIKGVLENVDEEITKRATTDSNLDASYKALAYDNARYCDLVYLMLQSHYDTEAFLNNYKYFVQFVKQHTPDIWQRMVDFKLLADGEAITEGVVFSINEINSFGLGKTAFERYVELCKNHNEWDVEYTKYDANKSLGNKYGAVFVNVNSLNEMQLVVKNESVINPDSSLYVVRNGIKDRISYFSAIAQIMSAVFLWAGIVMAVFSMLLLFNFITVSINAKRKEIGILRALGASSKDVFKIFLSESGVIVIICSIISAILTGIISASVNASISARLGITFKLFTFGIVPIAMIFGIAIVTAVISTFLPVWRNARKRPVEAIRQL